MTAQTWPPRAAAYWAKIITEATTPTVLTPLLLLCVAIHAASAVGWFAILWGFTAGVFVGAIPIAFIRRGVRAGRYDDHHVEDRRQRLIPFLITLISVATGCILLSVGHAPKDLRALILAMLIGLAAVLITNHWWKISVHSGTAAGSAVVVWLVFGPAVGLIAAAIAAGAGWSRCALQAHSRMQVAVGLLVGASTAVLAFPAFR